MQSIYGFVGANVQGLANRSVFAAGIAYNNTRYQRQSNEKDFKDVSFYTVAEYNFADMEMRYEDLSLKFSFGSLLNDTEGIIAPPPMVSFKRSKNLGITVIDTAMYDTETSEIVENFGINSWDIDIRGIMVDMDNHHYPKSKIVDITRFFEINDVIEIVSPLFQDLGITSIYFKEQSIEPVEAYPDTVKFSLQAKSIKPAEFTIIDRTITV
ncbi:hypothetical protein D0T56_14965 [Dysgonomonas sp. 520]|nr:hypothetical protein [Dysgonomonas sp. 520]